MNGILGQVGEGGSDPYPAMLFHLAEDMHGADAKF